MRSETSFIRTENNTSGQKPSGDSPRTFIEEARRKQIVQCAVDVIADHGYRQASLARIAKRASISKGVISYHFEGKDDLIHQVLVDYADQESAYITPRVDAEQSARAALLTYIRTNVEFMGFNPKHLKAVVEIVVSAQDSEGKRKFDITSVEWTETEIQYLEKILDWGQETGEFRGFCSRVMAIAIRGAIESLAMHVLTYPEIDLDDYADELTTMFDRATRADGADTASGE